MTLAQYFSNSDICEVLYNVSKIKIMCLFFFYVIKHGAVLAYLNTPKLYKIKLQLQ